MQAFRVQRDTGFRVEAVGRRSRLTSVLVMAIPVATLHTTKSLCQHEKALYLRCGRTLAGSRIS